MTPRRAAIILAIVAVALIATSVFFLPTGGLVSLLAAGGMAAGLAATGQAVVWATRSSWEPDTAPTPSTPDRAHNQRRARRVLRILGWVAIGLGVIPAALLFSVDSFAPSAVLRLAVLSATAVALGVVTLVAVRVAGRSRPEEDAEVEDDAPAVSGWIRVSQRDRATVLIFALPGLFGALWAAWQVLPAFLLLRNEVSFAVPIIVLGAAAVIVVPATWVWRRTPDVWVDVDAELVRAGSRTVAWSAVTAARVVATGGLTGGTRSVFLTLEGPDKLRLPLLLRRQGGLAMTPSQRRAAVALIEGADISLPRAKEDPHGKFSRTLFPTHVDAAQARDLVARPPRSDEDLPVTLV